MNAPLSVCHHDLAKWGLSYTMSHLRTALLTGASLVSMLAVQPAFAQTVSGIRGTAATGTGSSRPNTGAPVTTLPPTAQAALARQNALKARTATAMDLANQAQQIARTAALAKPSTTPNGIKTGGLMPAGAITTDPSLWQNANKPTETTTNGKTTVEIDQTASKAILTWDSFNVGKDTTVYFNQSAGTQKDGSNEWIALNRINDPSLAPSKIEGMIKAEGSVYLINRNGILFSGTAQVNTHSLIVSALPFLQDGSRTIDQSNQQFLGAGLADPLYTDAVFGSRGGTTLTGDVTIEAGAQIETKDGGFSIFAGNNVTNAGSIVSNDGQTILLAGVGMVRDAQNSVPGKLAFLSFFGGSIDGDIQSFSLVNTGSIAALRGDITFLGGSLVQSGLVMATTSITRPGSVEFRTASGLPSDGTAIFAPDSLTAILPDGNVETTSSSPAADDVFKPGSASINASAIWFQGDSTLYMPGASLSLTAAGNSSLNSPAVNGIQLGRTQIDQGAILSVAGLADVERPMSDNIITVPRLGQNELADSPLQRDGILYTSPFTVDSRDSGTRDDGLSWVGSPVANVGSYVQNQPRTVSQMLVDGGSIDMTTGSLVLAPAGTLDVSGGYTQYLGGSVQTSRLIGADGRIYSASTADPLMSYIGFAGQTTVGHSRWGVTDNYSNGLMNGGSQYESSYVQGGEGGSLSIAASQMVLSGALLGQTVAGRYQIGDGQEPQGSSLTLTASGLQLSKEGTDFASGDFSADASLFTVDRLALATNDIDNILWTPNVSAEKINSGGFSSVSLNADVITVDNDAALTVLPGGKISLTAGKMDVFGTLTAHAGHISLISTGVTGAGDPDTNSELATASEALNPISESGSGIPLQGNITVGSGAVLDVSGLWVNDFGASLDDRQGDSFINGGTIDITARAKAQMRYLNDQGLAGGAFDTSGSILLKEGSLLDASSGGYVDMLGRVATRNGIPIGKGGDISLRVYADNPDWNLGFLPDMSGPAAAPLTSARLEMDGTLKANGFSGGGALTLQALAIQIGGQTEGLPDYTTYIPENWFSDQGFGAYKLNALYDATIADGATVHVSQRNYTADLTKLARLDSGADIESVATLAQLDPFHRQPTDFALSAGSYLTWNAATEQRAYRHVDFSGVTGAVTIGEGASIQTDAGADVALSSYGQLTLDGSIVAHGGSVELTGLLDVGPGYDFTNRSILLGSDSLIDVSGVALIDPFTAPVRTRDGTKIPVGGLVLDGGSVSIQGTNAYVVAERGSKIDVSGAQAMLDIRTQSLSPFAPIAWTATDVASDGGSIIIGSTNGLYFDGTFVAAGGSAAARGGTLQIASIPAAATAAMGQTIRPPIARSILLQQSGDLVTDTMIEGGPVEGAGAPSGIMHFAIDRLDGSGIDTLILGGDPTQVAGAAGSSPTILTSIGFAGDVNLKVDRAVVLNATNYVALPEGATNAPDQSAGMASVGGTHVQITSDYVAVAGGSLVNLSPVLAAGDATLDVNARQIDLMGQFTLQRFGQANFTSSGDIRLMMPAELGYVNDSKIERPGELVTAGDLTFKAAQLYPATGNVFLIAAPTDGSTVTFLGNGSVAPPVSAGGALLVDAANIVQDGTIRAPSGTIQLGVGDVNDASIKSAFNNLPLIHTTNVTLGEGSLTSVSLDNRSLPYGTTTDGKDWALVVGNSNGTTTTTGTLTGPPEKLIGLAGDNVDFGTGATVDLSGGGNLYAQEWVPGTGGSRDLLNAVNTTYSSGAAATQTPLYPDGREVYAVMPGYQAPVAAYDPSFGYAGSDLTSSLGKAVYLSGVPGLPDGLYTLLPGQYATMPGAFRVVQQTGTIDSVSGDNVKLADGSQVVSGRFVDALTGKQEARTTSFLVQSQDVWKQYSEYTITNADDYFPGLAAHAGTSATRTPVDAGRLVLAAVNELILDGDLNAKAGDKGRGAAVDISAQAIQILGGSGPAQDGYLQVDATSLSNLGAESLLIGGTRSDGANGTTINATATSVVLSNDSSSVLTGPEVMLVTTAGGNGLVLESGSVLAAKGDIANASTAPILIGAKDGASGDGALVRVSNGGAVSVIRSNVPGLDGVDGTSTGLLDIRDGASIQGGKSTILDATGNLLLDPGASFSGDAVDVNANVIAFVGDGSSATPTGFVVGDALLAQLANIGSLGLHSRSTMSFYGDVDLATKQSLVLGAAAFASDGGNVTVTAPKLILTNDVGGTAEFAGGTGMLTLNAGELDFGGGAVALQGFGGVTATASQGIVGQGNGSFDFGTLDVNMTAPVFTADSGANTSIKTSGALKLNRGAGTAISRETLGGALSLSGGNLTTDATITASAGNVSLAATAGDLTLLDGAIVSTKGYNKTFFDTEAYAPAGNLTLTASSGAINFEQGATLDVSGADKGGDAGGLTLNASGDVILAGTLRGQAATSDYRGGRLTLASGAAVDLDGIADLTQTSGFTGGLSVTSGAGNLILSAGKTLKGQVIYLAANGGDLPTDTDGNVIVNGIIDVSGQAAGHIDLFGKSGVDLSGKLLATSSVAHQDGGVVTIGTTGVTDGTFNDQYGYENVQAADSGAIHVRNGALIDVSGGSDDAGGQVSFRAPLLSDGDVKIAIDGGNANIKGASRVTIEPYAKWSTADAQTDPAKYFDGIIDPAGWYGADGKLVAGQWTDDKGNVLDAPTDDQLNDYLSKYYFTPTTANADHVSFFGYVGGDPANGPGTLMGFTQAPGFTFDTRYAGIAGLHVRPGIELANPGEAVNSGDIDVLTNWNLGAGETDALTGVVTLKYRYGVEAPILTVRAENDINLQASITDGFYQQNDGAHLQDPVAPPPPPAGGDDAYNTALAAYQNSKDYIDANGMWTGSILLTSGGTADISSDPNYEPLRAPLTGQSSAYYANYTAYIGEFGDGSSGWASTLLFPTILGYLNYSPDNAPNGNVAPNPSGFSSYADYVSSYQSWLRSNFNNTDDAHRSTTPTPILQPVASDYSAYSNDYQGIYIPGHSDYYNYVINNVGNIFNGTQLYYAPFAPRGDAAAGGSAPYNTVLAAYQVSKNYLDSNGLWNGTINLVSGGSADITSDPNYEPLRAPLTGQSNAYYANYTAYIGEVGDGNSGWSANLIFGGIFGYLNYSPDNAPNGNVAPAPSNFPNYADYVTSYQSWLSANFNNGRPESINTTPTPLLQPIATDYTAYSSDYQSLYIPGHATYDSYIINNVGNIFGGTQLSYAPFAPRGDVASSGSAAYDAALAKYQVSKNYLDSNGLWNGTINLVSGGTADITSDPNYEPLRAPLAAQSNAYYANYTAYIGEVGDGNSGWSSNLIFGGIFGYLNYNPDNAPNGNVAPAPSNFSNYGEYVTSYQAWLSANFNNGRPDTINTTPTPLLQPIATDYSDYSSDYQGLYIPGHATYDSYIINNVGNIFGGTQLSYAPFAPRSDAASGGGGDGPTIVPVAPSHANNGPSNMPIAGSPASLASATLLGGESSSYRLVAGADFGAVDAMAINLDGSGSVRVAGHFEVIDRTTTDDAGNPLDPKNPAVGKTVVFPNLIRTGIGSIDIAAAGDIALLDPVAPGAIYTGGQPAAGTASGTTVSVVRPGLINASLNFSPTFLLTPIVQPDNGGDITLTAGGDIMGNQEMIDVDGTITGRKGTYLAQYWYPWLNTALQPNATVSSINFGNFDQGVLSAGGNVSVSAGRDIRELSVSLPTTLYLAAGASEPTLVGGGNVSVDAGGDILGGSFFIAKGVGRIEAGGSIGSAFTYNSVKNQAISSPVATFIGMLDAQIQITARGDVDLGRVFNPGSMGPSSLGISPFNTAASSLTAKSSLQLTSVTGDIDFGTLNAPQDFFGAYAGTIGGQDPTIPATIAMNALNGGILIAGDGTLYPSATGQLSLLADGDIHLVQTQTNQNNVFGMSQSSGGGAIISSTDPTVASQDIDGLLHFSDPEPARIYSLTGDIVSGREETAVAEFLGLQTNELQLYIPKATQIRAGRDIVNLVFLGQNLHDSDVTSIIAGRDIIDMPGGRNGVLNGDYPTFVTPGLIQLAGPGRLDIQAGRDLGPLDRDLTDTNFGSGRSGPSTGIQTIGNLYNPYLPRESADISVLFGTGPGVAWDAFAAAYLDPQAIGTNLPSFNKDLIAAVAQYQADIDQRAGGNGKVPDLTADEAWAAFQTMPEAQREALVQQTFFKVLQITGADEEDPNSGFFGQYVRGYQAIETLFPAAAGYTKNNLEGGANGAAEQITTGNLDIRGSTIQTQQGGNINIMGPGGQLLIGSTASPPYVPANGNSAGIGPQSQGILAWETGSVNIFADQSVLLAQSRIFTERGGDMTIWSSNGDINAGKGSKTSSEIKPVGFICSADFYCRVDSASSVTGAGIAAFAADPGDPNPVVTLAAPRGTVDFGDAGVRVAGNLIVAAQAVANADNVQVSGTTIGVPTNAVNVSANLAASSSAANAAQEAASAMQKARQNDQPSYVIITIDSFGTEPQY